MQYASSRREVWEALTDRRALGQWLMPLTAATGKRLRFGAIACEVLAAEPHARLVWRWRDPRDGRAFVIDWRLEAVGGGCRLRFEQREADEARGELADGLADAGAASFTAGAEIPPGDDDAAGDSESAGDLPGIAPDEVQVYGELQLSAA
jgi:uncharacterized protein YndB with AHSA1/START domain